MVIRMPTGQKKKSTDLINKQKRLIASRLMQISLDVDDYLYKQKRFSQQCAKAYIREISSYQDKCGGDERSLQVIEKLTRCMKAIIEEQQELKREGHTDEVIRSQDFKENCQVTASPVYSTADYDLTQTFENVEENEVFKKTQDEMTNVNNIESQALDVDDDLKQILDVEDNDDNRNYFNMYTDELNDIIQLIDADKEAVGIHEDEKDDFAKNNNIDMLQAEVNLPKTIYKEPGQNALVIDLNHEEIITMNNKNADKPTPESNIEKAISSLSIIDIEESQSATPLFQESQSILENFYGNQFRHLDIPLTQVDALKPAVTRKPEKKMKVIRDTNKNVSCTKLRVNPQTFTDDPGLAQIQTGSNVTVNAKIVKPRNKKTANDKNKSKPKVKKAANTKNNNPIELSKIKTTAIINNNTGIEVNTILTTDNHAKDETSMQQTQHKYNKANTQNNNMQENNAKYQETQCKVPEIYNTNVVDDLSWIENIRYVREVCTEEYESCTVDEVFWQNYTLPSNWNEDDFN